MGYQALYRKFRPRTFDEVLGQEHITTILKNQILNDNIAHAYLFSGTRGTGKTSTAKIFARAVNCENNTNGNPCNECEVCKKIQDESIMDVVEMDAASNNSVDDIRELREKVKYLPSKGRYKVYIIDEVHMLSKGAFNALLKTLEEPPKHLLFILATTEPQKLPATILSRCQRYDFKRLNMKDIVDNMKTICNDIDVEIEDRGLHLIARNADGAMRDALSILDQCVSFAEGKITHDYILSILGTVNNDVYFDMADHIINKDLNKALELIEYIVLNGKDIKQFIKDLILHFRNIMIAKSSKDLEKLVDASLDMIDRLKEQSKAIKMNNVIRIINILSEAEVQSKWSSQPRIILETSIIKIVSPNVDDNLEGLVNRIDELEEKINSGDIKINTTSKKKKIGKSKPKVKTDNVKKKATTKKEIKTNEKKEVKEVKTGNVNKDIDIKGIKNSWADILKKIKSNKISIHALLLEGKPVNIKGNVLIISFDDGFGFHKDAVDKADNKKYIEGIMNEFLNTDLKIKFVMESEIESQEEDVEENNEDLVEKAKNVFGEDLVEVE